MDAPNLACCTVEFIHGSQRGSVSERFAIEERLILHLAYAKVGNHQLVSLFSNQLAYFCALQGSSRLQMLKIAMQVVNYSNGNELESILHRRLLTLISKDFRDCRNALYSSESPAFLAQLSARTISAISESVHVWVESSNSQVVYDHIRQVLHETADRLNSHQRGQAVKDVEKWVSGSLKDFTVNPSCFAHSIWNRVIAFAGYQTSMKTIRTMSRSLFFACHDPKAWKHIKHIEIDFLWIPSTQEDIVQLFRRTPSLISLRCCRDPGKMTSQLISAICNFCHSIECIFFDKMGFLTDEDVEMLSKSCTSLKSLTLDSCTLLTDRALSALAKNCPDIETLSLNWCPKITLFPILTPGVFKYLRSLSVANANDREPDSLLEAAFPRALRLFSNLDRLVFSGRTQLDSRGLATLSISKLTQLDCSGITAVTDSWVSSISKICPNLKFVNFSKCPVATLDAAESSWHNIDHVVLSNCNMLQNDALHNLANCQRIAVINLSGCASLSDSAFSKPTKGWRSIRVLCLDQCSAVTDRSISAICKLMPNIESLSLRQLCHLSNSSISAIVSSLGRLLHLNISGCSRITDAGIGFLALSNCSLRNLDISNLVSITDVALQSLVSFGLLESLDISGCDKISYEGVLILCAAAFRSSLKALSLSECAGISDDIMKLIGICFPVLRDLNIASCQELSDSGVIALVSDSIINIRCLNFSRCQSITEASIRVLLRQAPHLRSINLSHCPRISTESIQILRHEFFGVHFIKNDSSFSVTLPSKLVAPPLNLDCAVTF